MPLPIKKLIPSDKEFPSLLKEAPGSPEQIFYMGNPPTKEEVTIAIVGTRKATDKGLKLAEELGREMGRVGLTVVSGLALGIDSAAHRGALSAKGKTVAVLGNGIDYIYPSQNRDLAQNILETGGAIISEYPEGTSPLPNQFLERNRIISGLSIAVVVIEAPIKSGSLSTAKHALEQGREVFVIPGPAGHLNYEGSHMLVRNGARLATNFEEIMEDLSPLIPNFQIAISDKEIDGSK